MIPDRKRLGRWLLIAMLGVTLVVSLAVPLGLFYLVRKLIQSRQRPETSQL